MAAKLNRTPGSVFVSVDAPPQKNAHAAISADWKSIAHEMIAEAPAAKPTPVIAPVSTPEPVSDNPVGDKMNALLAEADELLETKPSVNTQTISDWCYHYGTGITVKPRETNWDAPAVVAWNAYMHRKSDERMAYLRQRVEPKPAQRSPAIARDTNSRGEVLSAWGDVMEVSA